MYCRKVCTHNLEILSEDKLNKKIHKTQLLEKKITLFQSFFPVSDCSFRESESCAQLTGWEPNVGFCCEAYLPEEIKVLCLL